MLMVLSLTFQKVVFSSKALMDLQCTFVQSLDNLVFRSTGANFVTC